MIRPSRRARWAIGDTGMEKQALTRSNPVVLERWNGMRGDAAGWRYACPGAAGAGPAEGFATLPQAVFPRGRRPCRTRGCPGVRSHRPAASIPRHRPPPVRNPERSLATTDGTQGGADQRRTAAPVSRTPCRCPPVWTAPRFPLYIHPMSLGRDSRPEPTEGVPHTPYRGASQPTVSLGRPRTLCHLGPPTFSRNRTMQPSSVSPGSSPRRGRRSATPTDNGTSRAARKGGDARPGAPTAVCDGTPPSGHSPTKNLGPGVLPTGYR